MRTITTLVPRRRHHRRRLLAVAGAVVLILAGCGNSSEEGGDDGAGSGVTEGGPSSSGDVPGVTDGEIRFSAIGVRSNNPLGTCVLDCYVDGIEAYFAFRNSEGGALDHELVLSEVLDDELSNNQARALDVLSADDTFATFNATQIASGWADFAEAGVPLYVWGIHFEEMAGQESIFGYSGVRCASCTSRPQVYAGTMRDATKVAALGYGVSEASKQCAVAADASVDLYGDEADMEMGYLNENLEFGLPNGIGPEVTAMKEADVDFIIGCLDLNGMKTLAQELERQGMGDVPMLHSNTYDAAFVAEAGDLFEGDIVSVGFRPFEADPGDSQLGDFLEWMEETGSEVSELAMVGWINADTAYQGIVAAGDGFDRASVIEATNEMTEYTAGGLVVPIDWSRQHEAPTEDDPATNGYAQECNAYVEVVDGAFELIGEADAPFFCWDGTDREWAEPTATEFE